MMNHDRAPSPLNMVCSRPGHKGAADPAPRSQKARREVIRVERGGVFGRFLARLGAAVAAVPWGMVGLPVIHVEEDER